MSVVVADDSPLYRRSIARAVDAAPGLRLVGVVDGGEAAVNAVQTLAPDLLLVDLRMPDLDGVGVLERLSGHRTHKVLISASIDDDVARRALAAGASACLPKHLSCGEICAAALALVRR
ncbi:MAG: response regulator [Solirubrobacteraceae bacterium]